MGKRDPARIAPKTEASFKVHPGEKQQDGSSKVVGEMKVDVKYAARNGVRWLRRLIRGRRPR